MTRVLAIETSCDETGIAVVEGAQTPQGFTFRTLGAALLSQAALHAPYGGVYPNLAKREHEKNLPVILEQALAAAGHPVSDVDAIAVTQGPGLEPALWSGINFAQKLAAEYDKPLLPINHMEGHLVSSLAQPSDEHSSILQNVKVPVLALLISGGHTEFVVMRDWFDYRVIGETLDDAVGEAFDKVARMLGLGYPGGPAIAAQAALARAKSQVSSIKLPRPMLSSNNCDVSFSGLKTAALYALRDGGDIQKLSTDEVAAFAREFEDTVTEVFIAKTRRALRESNAKTFVIGGGVAANTHIRESLVQFITKEFPEVEIRLPALSITGDNAIMIAEAALLRLLMSRAEPQTDFRAIGNLSIAAPQKMS